MKTLLAILASLGLFFGTNTNKVQTPKTTIILTGDVMLGRTVMIHSLDKAKDPKYPFLKVADTLQKADLVFINLESPIIDACPRYHEGYKFCTSPEIVEGLTYAGVDIVSLANNHSGNYGQDGLEQTVDYLNKAGISVTGLGNLTIKQFNPPSHKASEGRSNISFGFLGFDFVSRQPKNGDFELVKNSSSQVDVLIVGVHWGAEYQPRHSESQELIAKSLIGAGADVIIGHHPHWIQEIEYINEVPVYYSLGNFIFDQMWSEETKKGLAVRLTFEGKNIIKEEFLPTYMSSWSQPEFVDSK